MKGYYYEDRELVSKIKTKVVGAIPEGTFKTIECSMMDVADDIAYSTYGLEDNFKAGFLQPLDLFDVSDEIAVNVAATTQKRIREAFPELPVSEQTFSTDDMLFILFDIFKDPLLTVSHDEIGIIRRRSMMEEAKKMILTVYSTQVGKRMASDGYERVKFTSSSRVHS